jgi:hypothetical protein
MRRDLCVMKICMSCSSTLRPRRLLCSLAIKTSSCNIARFSMNEDDPFAQCEELDRGVAVLG